jgi:hypothetical protein
MDSPVVFILPIFIPSGYSLQKEIVKKQ